MEKKNKELAKMNSILVTSNNLYQEKMKQMNEALLDERRYYRSVLEYVLKRSNRLG